MSPWRAGRIGLFLLANLLFASFALPASAAEPAKVYVVLWFDTEDYILPASDDAALRVADFLTRHQIRATFKVVGEKARTLERRGRTDVIEALKKHEIGYHSNFHSVQPSPAMYLANLGWDDGVAEFDRRERPGYDDVQRIFGQTPSCYGQPGSSWGPQSYGALNKWGMGVYLDSGNHVNLENKPFYYCGILNLFRLEHTLRAKLEKLDELKEAENKFLVARTKLLAEQGGIVSIYYHPCEFVHKEFWDGVNFRKGANPPRDQWKLPPMKTPEESRIAYEIFDRYIEFIQRFPEVQFITATEALKLYRDRARGRSFTQEELRSIAVAVREQLDFYLKNDYVLSAGEAFALLNQFAVQDKSAELSLSFSPLGPASAMEGFSEPVTTDTNQFQRTVADVADSLKRERRIPSIVWLGSVPVSPEAYLHALAEYVVNRIDGKSAPESITLKPVKLASARFVANDGPDLWGWVIFPPNFRAPQMMTLAKRQAWTLKPARLQR